MVSQNLDHLPYLSQCRINMKKKNLFRYLCDSKDCSELFHSWLITWAKFRMSALWWRKCASFFSEENGSEMHTWFNGEEDEVGAALERQSMGLNAKRLIIKAAAKAGLTDRRFFCPKFSFHCLWIKYSGIQVLFPGKKCDFVKNLSQPLLFLLELKL